MRKIIPNKVSVVIPSRNEQFLQKTIEDLLKKAREDIEIIAVLDGYWPTPIISDDPRVILLHRSQPLGMRNGINSAVSISSGEYIMKCDAHCMFDDGFDIKLKADIEDNWVVVPRRKRLDAENWCIQDVGKIDIDYEYLSYPDDPADFGGPGLNGKVWDQRSRERKDILIDDNISFQGSCWFMKKNYFYELELMDEKSYGPFWNEAQEIGLKAWLSGGRVVTNKKTWYAHLHKGKKYGRGYHLPEEWLKKGRNHTMKWIHGNAWHKQKLPLTWLIEKFWPVPTWPEDRNLWLIKDEVKPIVISDIKKPEIRDDLPRYFAQLGLKTGAEIGVEQAVFTEILCKAGLKVFAIDAWSAYKGYREHVSQEKLNGFYEATKAKLSPYDCDVIKSYSMDALSMFEDESLDWVYIDANHDFKNAAMDIVEWSRKVRKGGIVSGHDYTNRNVSHTNHVREVVDAFAKAYGLEIFLTSKDRSPSWYYIKS